MSGPEENMDGNGRRVVVEQNDVLDYKGLPEYRVSE